MRDKVIEVQTADAPVFVTTIRETKFLAVHFALNTPEDAPGRKYYTVTHKPTGHWVLRRFESAEDAILAMERISGLDWDFSEERNFPSESKKWIRRNFAAHIPS